MEYNIEQLYVSFLVDELKIWKDKDMICWTKNDTYNIRQANLEATRKWTGPDKMLYDYLNNKD